MAKKAMIERELKRIRMVEKYSAKRSSLKQIIRNVNSSDDERELAQKKFELPISMAKTVEFFIQKGHEEFKSDANRKAK